MTVEARFHQKKEKRIEQVVDMRFPECRPSVRETLIKEQRTRVQNGTERGLRGHVINNLQGKITHTDMVRLHKLKNFVFLDEPSVDLHVKNLLGQQKGDFSAYSPVASLYR